MRLASGWSLLVPWLALACTEAHPAPPPLLPREALRPRFARWESFLQSYLRVDTTNPPGNERRAFPLLEETLREIGLTTSTIAAIAPQRGDLFARLAAGRPDPESGPLILLHHIDVVPQEAGKWSLPPFSGGISEGRIHGRGAIDDKLLGALQLAALERLAAAKDRLKRDVIFLAVSDEEGAGLGAQAAIQSDLATWRPA
jgi:acetylornithine deacetylase/succinyl-diaminopimelate desuccinylase-like protein